MRTHVPEPGRGEDPDAILGSTPPPQPPTPPAGGPTPSKDSILLSVEWLAPGATALGLALSLLSLLLPWATASTFLTGTVSEGPPPATAATVVLTGMAGLAALVVAFNGQPKIAIGCAVAAGTCGLIALDYLASAVQASQQSVGMVDLGPGPRVLLLSSTITGVASLVMLVRAQRNGR